MIICPPLTAFMVVMLKVNRDMANAMRYRTGRTGFLVLIYLTFLWLWVVLYMLPGLRDVLADPSW